jgi:hypothetical protein
LQQGGQAFKLKGSVSGQVTSSERLSCIAPETGNNTTVPHSNDAVRDNNTMNAVTAIDQHMDDTSIGVSVHRISSVRAPGKLIKLSGMVNRIRAVILVDSGSTGDFISEEYVRQHKLPVQECEHSKSVWLADGKQYTVRSYVESTVRVGNLVESIELAVIPLSDFDVIVGTPWLKRHNPVSTGVQA